MITEYFADTFIQVNRTVLKESTQQEKWQIYTTTGKVYKEFCEHITMLNTSLDTFSFFLQGNMNTIKKHALYFTHIQSKLRCVSKSRNQFLNVITLVHLLSLPNVYHSTSEHAVFTPVSFAVTMLIHFKFLKMAWLWNIYWFYCLLWLGKYWLWSILWFHFNNSSKVIHNSDD